MTKINSYCKVNLFLLIGKKNKSKNLHKLKSVFYKIDNLYDVLEIEINKSKDLVEYYFKNEKIKIDNCILLKTIRLLKENNLLDKNTHFKIKVEKNIPLFSGLGSGSSNAGTLIRFLLENKMIKQSKKLNKVSLLIGSDVLFFVKNYKIALVFGYGNKMIKLKNKNLNIKTFFTDIKCSTKDVFEHYKKQNKKHSFLKMFFYFKINKYELLSNELETSCFSLYPSLKEKKNKLEDELKRKVFLSGSGGTLFSIG